MLLLEIARTTDILERQKLVHRAYRATVNTRLVLSACQLLFSTFLAPLPGARLALVLLLLEIPRGVLGRPTSDARLENLLHK